MTWTAVAIVGAGALGAGASIYGANKQSKAANQASSNQLAQFQQTRSDLMPWQQEGQQALSQLSAGTKPGGQFAQPFTLQQFQQSPGYQFQVNQFILAFIRVRGLGAPRRVEWSHEAKVKTMTLMTVTGGIEKEPRGMRSSAARIPPRYKG